MKQDCKICVICHLYYQNLWPEIKNYLSNFTFNFSKNNFAAGENT